MVGWRQYSVGMGKKKFPCLYVWQTLLSEVQKDVGTSNVYGNLCFLFVAYEFIFPLLLREFFTLCLIAWKIYFFLAYV